MNAKAKIVLAIGMLVMSLIAYSIWLSRNGRMRVLGNSGVYKAEFRKPIGYFSEPETVKLYRWRLDMPRKYVYSHNGRNAAPFNKKQPTGSQTYSVKLMAVIDKETMTIKPHPKKTWGGGDGFVSIRLSNGRVRRDRHSVDRCLKPEELYLIPGPKFGTLPQKPCSVYNKNCHLYTHMGGWPVNISIDRKLYDDPQPYCELIKEFLEGMTVSRDAMPKKVR